MPETPVASASDVAEICVMDSTVTFSAALDAIEPANKDAAP